jgi:chloramphenicol O-acetyltransferase
MTLKSLKTKVLVCEIYNKDNVEWGISFNGSNPKDKDYFKCLNKKEAFRLTKRINKIVQSGQEKERKSPTEQLVHKEIEILKKSEAKIKKLHDEYIKNIISKIENKSNFVNAYANGPLLKDSLIITMDDWLKIKNWSKLKNLK